jgi:hypothetical protein
MVKYVRIIIFISAIHTMYSTFCAASTLVDSVHNVGPTPQSEGWSWATSFKYQHPKIDTSTCEAHFEKIHREMMAEAKKIKDSIWGDQTPREKNTNPNLNLIRISFVVSSQDPSLPHTIVLTTLFKDHVFLSGTTPPKVRYDFKCLADPAFSLGELDFVARPDEWLSKAFIYPPGNDMIPREMIIRCKNRFAERDRDTLPKVAQLAHLFNDQACDADMLAWFRQANGSSTFFQGGQPKPDDPLFFKHLQDSEQKVLYYLDHVSEWMKLCPYNAPERSFFAVFAEVIENQIGFFSTRSAYIAQQVRDLINLIPQDSDLKKSQTTVKHEEKIAQHIEMVRSSLKERNQNHPTNLVDKTHLVAMEYHLKVITNLGKEIQDEKFTKRDLTTTAIGNLLDKQQADALHERDISKGIAKLKDLLKEVRPRTASLQKFIAYCEGWVEKLECVWRSVPVTAEELKEAINDLTSLRTLIKNDPLKKKYEVETFPQDFAQEVLAISSAQGLVISGIILHIHSTNDVCYTCAPDLAQESVSRSGFVDRLQEYIEGMNLDNFCPSFQIINSCEDIRPCRAYTDVSSIDEPRLFNNPIQGIRFYQHLLKPVDPSNLNSKFELIEPPHFDDGKNQAEDSDADTDDKNTNVATSLDDPVLELSIFD